MPQVGIVSLGCPKALVDSERILTKLRAGGAIDRTYVDAPEIDSLAHIAEADDLTIGERTLVRITDADDYDLFGSITEGS